jgi:hypothetical protein
MRWRWGGRRHRLGALGRWAPPLAATMPGVCMEGRSMCLILLLEAQEDKRSQQHAVKGKTRKAITRE